MGVVVIDVATSDVPVEGGIGGVGGVGGVGGGVTVTFTITV